MIRTASSRFGSCAIMSITPTRFLLCSLSDPAIDLKVERWLLNVERSSNEAREIKGHFTDLAWPQRNQTARFAFRSPPGNISKSNPPQLPHSFRDGRFHLSLSGHRPTR